MRRRTDNEAYGPTWSEPLPLATWADWSLPAVLLVGAAALMLAEIIELLETILREMMGVNK